MKRLNATSLASLTESRSLDIAPTTGYAAPLRRDWVERIFAVLSAGFGQQFADKWSCADPDEMKALWANKLAGFFDQPDALRKALDEATDASFPPNIGEFKKLCQKHYVDRSASYRAAESAARLMSEIKAR